jgi:hypothetical protein
MQQPFVLWLPSKQISLPKRSLCVFSNNKNKWFTEIKVRGKYGEQ